MTGIDIVHQQLKIASGLPLEFKQSDVTIRGHSIESRIYAENPTLGFLPAAGPLLRLKMPEGPGIRVDSGVVEGNEISINFDPMIAKIIVHAENRDTAIMRMKYALNETVLLGLDTNVEFLHALLCDEDVKNGNTTTNLIETKWPNGWKNEIDLEAIALGAIACAVSQKFGTNKSNQMSEGSMEIDPFKLINNKFP